MTNTDEIVVSQKAQPHSGPLLRAIAAHWPEYLMEAAGLGLFMLSACLFVALIEYPASPIRQAIDDPFVRRAAVGVAMGLTAVCLIYSPWGKQSGAHFNPAVTLTFWRLGKIAGPDAALYIVMQFVGGTLGVIASALLLGRHVIADASVNFVLTLPGSGGAGVALWAEAAISFSLMLTVLIVANRPSINRFTGLLGGALVASFITFEAPLSGMSMNPARSFASALPAGMWQSLWIYFLAPPLGMLAAAEVYLRAQRKQPVLCCKLHHDNDKRCIFRCAYPH
ncbi:MAG TPA: aquaporin [Burkholderiales bacterium]|nr:aquaporin [Burkholderiales bacterium]